MPEEAEFYIHVTDNMLDPQDQRLSRVLGWKDFDLFRQPVEFLFPPDAHGRIGKLFSSDRPLEQVVFPKVPLRYHAGGYINFDMTLSKTTDGDWRLDFFKPDTGTTAQEGQQGADTVATQDMSGFFNFVQDILESPFDGDIDMSFVEVAGLRQESDLSDENRRSLRENVEKELKSQAVGGRIGKIDNATYGFLTTGEFEEEAFEEELRGAAEKLGIASEDLGVRSRQIAIDEKDLSREQMTQALGQAAKSFTGEIEDDPTATRLSAVISGLEHHLNLIKSALRQYDFRAGKRLIFRAQDNQRTAILVEGKVGIDGHYRRPDELVNMVDHADLALDHDLAQLEDIIRLQGMDARKAIAKGQSVVPIYYNLCRACLLSPDFISRLSALIKGAGLTPDQIGLRLKGLPPIKRGGPHWDCITQLKTLGFRIWVDRFGDAVSGDKLTNLLEFGMIEMPQILLKKLVHHYDGKDLIKNLVSVWQAKNVTVVSADFTEEKWKRQSLDAGIGIYLSGDPLMD